MPLWGVRCLDTEVVPLAEGSGFVLHEVVTMPANNLTVIFRRRRDPFFDTEVVPLAEESGFVLHEVATTPANNLTVIFRRRRDPFTKDA